MDKPTLDEFAKSESIVIINHHTGNLFIEPYDRYQHWLQKEIDHHESVDYVRAVGDAAFLKDGKGHAMRTVPESIEKEPWNAPWSVIDADKNVVAITNDPRSIVGDNRKKARILERTQKRLARRLQEKHRNFNEWTTASEGAAGVNSSSPPTFEDLAKHETVIILDHRNGMVQTEPYSNYIERLNKEINRRSKAQIVPATGRAALLRNRDGSLSRAVPENCGNSTSSLVIPDHESGVEVMSFTSNSNAGKMLAEFEEKTRDMERTRDTLIRRTLEKYQRFFGEDRETDWAKAHPPQLQLEGPHAPVQPGWASNGDPGHADLPGMFSDRRR